VQLVMGLGNPGVEYAATRHNVGFMCVQALAERLELSFDQVTGEYVAAVGAGPAGPVTLMLPLTYMNRSGRALQAWARRTGLTVAVPPPPDEGDEPSPPAEVTPLVVCDDIQLPLGSVRIRAKGSDGGQNGLASVIEAVGANTVPRMRLGVGPLVGAVDPAEWADYVLTPFAENERPQVDDLIARSVEALVAVLSDGPELAGSRHNRRIRPEPDLPAED